MRDELVSIMDNFAASSDLSGAEFFLQAVRGYIKCRKEALMYRLDGEIEDAKYYESWAEDFARHLEMKGY